MTAIDRFQSSVITALIRDGWSQPKPLPLKFGSKDVKIDLSTEKILFAEKDRIQIAVEVKSFVVPSIVYAWHGALGQYLNYCLVLEHNQLPHIPYLAVPAEIYDQELTEEFFQTSIRRYQVNLLMINSITEEIVQWNPDPQI